MISASTAIFAVKLRQQTFVAMTMAGTPTFINNRNRLRKKASVKRRWKVARSKRSATTALKLLLCRRLMPAGTDAQQKASALRERCHSRGPYHCRFGQQCGGRRPGGPKNFYRTRGLWTYCNYLRCRGDTGQGFAYSPGRTGDDPRTN